MARATNRGKGFGWRFNAARQRDSRRIDPQVAKSARQSDTPDVDIYEFPATHRISPANLALSIVVLVIALALAILLFLFVYRR